MIKFSLLLLTLCAATSQASTSNIKIERVFLGSGLQNATGTENAAPVADFGVWHVPQYMPGYPTAETIWPRVINVRCIDNTCEGYSITPKMGRGEYLFFRPVKK